MSFRRFVPGTLVALILAGCNTSSTPPAATVALVGPDGKAISFPTPAPIPTTTNVNSYGYNFNLIGTGTIRGRVIDINGNPIPSAKVFISGKEVSTAVTAGSDGAFTISNVTEPSFSLIASAPGYLPTAFPATAAGTTAATFVFPNVQNPVISVVLQFANAAAATGVTVGSTATNFGSSGNSISAPVAVAFARSIDPGSLGTVTATLVGFTTAAIPGTGQTLSIKAELDTNRTTLTLTPLNSQGQASTWGPSADHTVVRFNLSGLRDSSGNPIFTGGSNTIPGFTGNGIFELAFTSGQAVSSAPTWPSGGTFRLQSVTNIQGYASPFVGLASTSGTLNTIDFSTNLATPTIDYNTSAATLGFSEATTPSGNEIIGYKLFVTSSGNSADITGTLTSGLLGSNIIGGTVTYGPTGTGGQLITPPASGSIKTVGLDLGSLPGILTGTGTPVWGRNSYVFQLYAVDKYGRIVGGSTSSAFADTTPPVINPNRADTSGMKFSSVWAGNGTTVTAAGNSQQGMCRVAAQPSTAAGWDMAGCSQLAGATTQGLIGQLNSLTPGTPPPPGLWLNFTEPLDKVEAEKTLNYLWMNRLTGDTTALPAFAVSYAEVLASNGAQVTYTASNGSVFPTSVVVLQPTTATQTWFGKVKQEIWVNNTSATAQGTIKDKTGNVFPAAIPSAGASKNYNAVITLPDLIPPRTVLPFVATSPSASPSPQAGTWTFNYVAPTNIAAGTFTLTFDESLLTTGLTASAISLSGVNSPSAAPSVSAGITDSTVASPFPTLTRSATWVIPTGAPSAAVNLTFPSGGAPFTDAGSNAASPMPASPIPIATASPFGNSSGSF